jgi:hypothetical protein
VNQVDADEISEDKKIYLILTCAHNLCEYNSYKEETQIAHEIMVIFGKN